MFCILDFYALANLKYYITFVGKIVKGCIKIIITLS